MNDNERMILAYAIQAIDRLFSGLASGVGCDDWDAQYAAWSAATEPVRRELQQELNRSREDSSR